ncbi:MaoC/PaaZ C-terminal domain-containing protein [Chloroflexota bacterium]
MTERNNIFQRIEVGMPIPPLVKNITRRQLFMYSAATWDFHPGHYDPVFARGQGFEDVYLDGPLNAAFLAQLITNWAGANGSLQKMSVTYRNMVFPGDILTSTGKVDKKYVVNDVGILECSLSLTNQKGGIVAEGRAEITFSL